MIKINKSSLNKQLMFLMSGVPSKPIIHVESWIHVKIVKETEGCYIKIANAKVEMSTFVKAESDDDYEFCVPSLLFSRTVANFSDGAIEISPEKNSKGDIIKIIMKPEGKRKKYEIACFANKEEFAHWPENKDKVDCEFSINMAELSDKIRISGTNVDNNETREQFSNIVFLSYKGKLVFVSANSAVLSFIPTEVDFSKSKIVYRGLPKYLSIIGMNEECNITMTDSRINIVVGSNAISTRLVDGAISNYPSFFERNPSEKITINRVDLLNSMQILSSFSSDTRQITLDVKNENIKLTSSDKNHSGEDYLDIQNPHNIEQTISANISFIERSISNMKNCESIEIGFKDQIFIQGVDDKTKQLWMVSPMGKL